MKGSLTPKPPEWIDTAPFKIRCHREMRASPEEVWAALIDHDSWAKWFEAILWEPNRDGSSFSSASCNGGCRKS